MTRLLPGGHIGGPQVFSANTDLTLLAGETSGFAVNFNSATPSAQVRTAGSDVYTDVQTFFTHAGTSPKFVHNSDGVMTWCPHNIAISSQVMSGWNGFGITQSGNTTTAPDGTSTADTLTADAGSSGHTHQQAGGCVVNNAVTCNISCHFKQLVGRYAVLAVTSFGATQWIAVTADLQTGTITQATAGAAGTLVSSTITSAGNGWYRVSFVGRLTGFDLTPHIQIVDTPTPTHGSNATVTWTAAGTETIYVWGVQLSQGATLFPYRETGAGTNHATGLALDYSSGSYGLLIEPVATNYLLYSEDFTTTWTKTFTVTANNTTAPDGNTTADKIAENSTQAQKMYQDTTTSSVTTFTSSIYVKNGDLDTLYLTAHNQSTKWGAITFNLSTAAITQTSKGAGQTANPTGTITSIGNGWYRLTFTITFDAATTTPQFGYALVNTPTPSHDSLYGDVVYAGSSKFIYAWGAQAETGTVATSYIPTNQGTATRAIDNISVATSAYPHSATANTHYVDFVPLGLDGTDSNWPWALNDGTNDEVIYMYAPYADGNTYIRIVDGSVTQCELSRAISHNTRNQVTFAWAANDADATVNAQAIQSDATVTLPTVTKLDFGRFSGAVGNIKINRFVQVPRQVETSSGNLATWRYNF